MTKAIFASQRFLERCTTYFLEVSAQISLTVATNVFQGQNTSKIAFLRVLF